MKYYTGVGSRKTPVDILDMMTRLALAFAYHGYTLRSGGAYGADQAFEKGSALKEIFYPIDIDRSPIALEALALAAKFHPAWNHCSAFAKRLHGRNAFQVLGRNLSVPSEFLICWTPDGCTSHATRSITTGGTGTAISIASAHGIPVNNLARPEHWLHWNKYLTGGK